MQQESNTTLEILIHDYLKKRNYTESALHFRKEANIPDYNPKECIPLLFEWFNAFNDIYNVRSGRIGCQENLARIENVMLKLENEKRRYKNMEVEKYTVDKYTPENYQSEQYQSERYTNEKYPLEKNHTDKYPSERYPSERYLSDKFMSDKSMNDKLMTDKFMTDKYAGEKSKSIHEMGYSHADSVDKYSEYITPKASKHESKEPKFEKRSYSEAYDRRNSYEGKIKSNMGGSKQYYGRPEDGDGLNYTDGQRYTNIAGGMPYGTKSAGPEGERGMAYSNEYQRMAYVNEPGRPLYKNEPGRLPYENEPRLPYENEIRLPYESEIGVPPFDNESSRLAYGNEDGRLPYGKDNARINYSKDKMPYDTHAYKSEDKMPYDTHVYKHDDKMPYSEANNYDGHTYKNAQDAYEPLGYKSEDKMSYNTHTYKGDYHKMGYGAMKYQHDAQPPYEKTYSGEDPSVDNAPVYAKDYKAYECLNKVTSFQLHKQRISAICVSNKHGLFVTGGHDQAINIVDIRTFRTTRIDLNAKIISDIKINEATNELLVAADSDVYVYKLCELIVTRVLREHSCTIKNINIDGDFLYTTDVEGTLKKWKGYEVVGTVDLHANRSVVFKGVLVVSDRTRVFTYDYDKRAIIDVLYEESAFIKVYDDRIMLFLKTKVVILDTNFESVNVIVCNEKVQSGCILSDSGVLLGFYQGMTKHINNEMYTVNSEGNVTLLEKYVNDNELVVGGCYDGSVVVWEHQ